MARKTFSAMLKKDFVRKHPVAKKKKVEIKKATGKKKHVPGADMLEKWPFKRPDKKEAAAVFNQYYLTQTHRMIVLYQCNQCNSKSQKYEGKRFVDGTPALQIALCPSCVLANRRAQQSAFFNCSLKNIHDKVNSLEEEESDDEPRQEDDDEEEDIDMEDDEDEEEED